MDIESHSVTLISIIVGLGLTEMFGNLHRLIRNRERVRWDFLPLAWVVTLFTVVLNYWWALYMRLDQLREPERARKEDHQRRQTIGDEHDPERCRPVSEVVNAPLGRIDEAYERACRRDEHERCRHADRGLERQAPFVQEQHRGARGQRQHDGHDDEVLRWAHSSGSRPST